MSSKARILTLLASTGLLILSFQNFSYPPLSAAACAAGVIRGPVTVSSDTVIANRDCVIAGDLVVTGKAVLKINYLGKTNNKFVVRGNVTVDADAKLQVAGSSGHGDLFVIASDYNLQRSMTSKGNGSIFFQQIEFRTQENVDPAKGSVGMVYQAEDSSSLMVKNSKLVFASAWFLGYFHDRSKLAVYDSQSLPTETYIHDASTIRIHGESTSTGLWLDAAGAKGSLTLPDVRKPFSWRVGRQNGLDVGWLLHVVNSNPGLGVEVKSDTNIEITGFGKNAPKTGELKIGYFVENAAEDLVGLDVGIQNRRISNRLKLNSVQLGPVAWQVYAGNNALVKIKNSKINEIGIYGPNGRVLVENSILQFALLGAMAPGSRLDIVNSRIWSQSLEAEHDAEITINGSHIYGSLFHARSDRSKISISNSAFHRNPAGCTPSKMVNVSTGVPLCNPFRAPGLPSKAGAGLVSCRNTSGCSF